MARIIAGEFKGRRLISIPSNKTRPTSDRIKESLFSRLEAINAIDDAVVLDLFAGSGALGCEALSRGARRVELVDKAQAAYRTLQRNVELCTTETRGPGANAPDVRSHRADALSYLRQRQGPALELVFLDPPYDLDQHALTNILWALAPQLDPAATVVVERDQHAQEPLWPDSMSSFHHKTYGSTQIWFGEVAPGDYA